MGRSRTLRYSTNQQCYFSVGKHTHQWWKPFKIGPHFVQLLYFCCQLIGWNNVTVELYNIYLLATIRDTGTLNSFLNFGQMMITTPELATQVIWIGIRTSNHKAILKLQEIAALSRRDSNRQPFDYRVECYHYSTTRWPIIITRWGRKNLSRSSSNLWLLLLLFFYLALWLKEETIFFSMLYSHHLCFFNISRNFLSNTWSNDLVFFFPHP